MEVWKLKSCPRCGGDMSVERSIEGWQVQCLQCSHCIEYKKRFLLVNEIAAMESRKKNGRRDRPKAVFKPRAIINRK